MKFTDVPIPTRMQHLPRDHRGYPIPVNVLVDSDGKPHFTINEEDKRQKLLREDRCPICGGKLLRGRWSVGGPASAFHPTGAYIDSPMHYECVRYALQVCPYLATPSYAKRLDDKTLDRSKAPGVLALIDPTVIANRPDPFVAVMHVGQKYVLWDWGGIRLIKPNRPYRNVEYWSNGVQLPDAEGERRAVEYLAAMSA